MPKTKTTPEAKTKTTYEIVNSDRVDLCSAANRLVECITTKQMMPYIASVPHLDCELTEGEQKAYEAALEYLARQFSIGHRDLEVITKEIEPK